MYNIDKRAYFTTLGELKSLISEYPDETTIYACGAWGVYLHVDQGNRYISFDDDCLDSYYYDDYPDLGYEFFDAKNEKEQDEHNERCKVLFPTKVCEEVR